MTTLAEVAITAATAYAAYQIGEAIKSYTHDQVAVNINLTGSVADGAGSISDTTEEESEEQKKHSTKKKDDVIHVTPQGVAIPPDSKYQINLNSH